MNRSRRTLLAGFGAALLCKGMPHAIAQSYPTKPVKIIVAWPPGSFADLSARLLGQKLGEAMGQTFIVENRPGATGIVGTGVVAKARQTATPCSSIPRATLRTSCFLPSCPTIQSLTLRRFP